MIKQGDTTINIPGHDWIATRSWLAESHRDGIRMVEMEVRSDFYVGLEYVAYFSIPEFPNLLKAGAFVSEELAILGGPGVFPQVVNTLFRRAREARIKRMAEVNGDYPDPVEVVEYEHSPF